MIGIGLLCGDSLGAFVKMMFYWRTSGGVGTLCVEVRESQISSFFILKKGEKRYDKGRAVLNEGRRAKLR